MSNVHNSERSEIFAVSSHSHSSYCTDHEMVPCANFITWYINTDICWPPSTPDEKSSDLKVSRQAFRRVFFHSPTALGTVSSPDFVSYCSLLPSISCPFFLLPSSLHHFYSAITSVSGATANISTLHCFWYLTG
jgi:hypothetical protein